MNCFTIPADKPFISHLAGWILGTYGENAAELTKILILLPNRRSCRALREAFLEITGGKPLLLPRIQPIGDVQEAFSIHYANLTADIPPAISQVKREFMLTNLVMDFKKKQAQAVLGRIFNVEQAADLARQLASFMDEVARYGVSFEGLAKLVPEELQTHWQQTLDFLKIISHEWPKVLMREGVIDPIDHRNLMLEATAKAWREQPPQHAIIAAGSTGSSPATALLLSTIARLPEGRVVLPALDTDMPKSEWDGLTETHPQFALKQLLETMECLRSSVQPLDATAIPTPRIQCLRAVLQSPQATAGWSKAKLPLLEGFRGLRLLTAETLHDEARMIAIALRQTLETPARTAALITPDRTLARMVASQMQRFGVEIDDSAGHALADTPTGNLMRLLIDMVAQQAAPVSLLALLRHPLAAAGRVPAQCRALSRRMELELLRGLRHAPGIAALRDASGDVDVRQLLAELAQRCEALFACFTQKTVPFATMLKAHLECAQWLASTDSQSGEERLWSGESGNAFAQLMAELLENAGTLQDLDPTHYAGLFDVLIGGHSYYPRFGLHPRLHILSPMEARLQRFDLVILGSLNEGTWPAPSPVDPWMSRPMRHEFKLPPVQRDVGQSAHDVYMACASSDVLLTRSQKVDGTPTIPSRWLVRLETLVKGLDAPCFEAMNAVGYYKQALRLLDVPEPMQTVQRPMPKPPVDIRPRSLKVTAVDEWLADPYRLYARTILRLRTLKELDQDPDAADFGNMVHKAMEQFVALFPASLPANPLEELIACGRNAFAEMMVFPAVASLWWPRFEAIAVWIVEQEIARRSSISKIMAELKGQWDFDVDGKPFTLVTRIDRLEVNRDGTITLADYKTGMVPSDADITSGRKNQMLLEALVAMHGTIEAALAKPLSVAQLEYWKLSGRHDSAKISQVDVLQIPLAQARLESLIRKYDSASEPYAPPAHSTKQNEQYNDYAHLSRRQEWGEA